MGKLNRAKTPRLASSLNFYEKLALLFSAGGTLLAGLDLQVWIALTVALSTSLSNIVSYQMLQQRLMSHNTAIRELQNQVIWINSLSIVQRRTKEVKRLCVGTCETAVLDTVQAWTGMTARPPDGQTKEGGE